MSTDRQIRAAQLNGRATRLGMMKDDEAGDEAAVAELHEVTTDPVELGEVAGSFWVEVDDPLRAHVAPGALRLLVLAGADRVTAERVRDEYLARGSSAGHSTP